MAVKARNQWWPWLVFFLIVVCGVGFSILAGFLDWIDTESGRYLLSSIVQSLAALLAIIFAGVAILWGQEVGNVRQLIKIRDKVSHLILDYTQKSDDTPIKKTTEWSLNFVRSNLNEMDDAKKRLAKEALSNILSLYNLDVENLKTRPGIQMIKTVRDFLGEPSSTDEIEKLVLNSHDLTKLGNIEKYWEVVRKAGEMYNLHSGKFFDLCQGAEAGVYDFKTTIDYPHLMLLRALQRRSEEARVLLSQKNRSYRARGAPFILLALLYTVTIALGLGSLALLNKELCSMQAATVSCITLAFSFVAVAATFVYLHYVVSEREEA